MANKHVEIGNLPVEYRSTTLGMTKKFSFKEAEAIAATLERMSGAVQFWIGDFLNIAEKSFGEDYTQLVPAGDAKETWRKYKWVCERVLPKYRREALSFTHHEIVASFLPEEQDTWLKKAEEKGWSKTALKEAILAEKALNAPKDKKEKDGADDKAGISWVITCPKCGEIIKVGKDKDGEEAT